MINNDFKSHYTNKLKKYSNGLNPGLALFVIENRKISFEATYGFACLKKIIK